MINSFFNLAGEALAAFILLSPFVTILLLIAVTANEMYRDFRGE